ncbi:MAG: hypothetical protein KDA49_02940, partial [Rhodospirillaceae bacterium]|nr:hypothetical protein [Rhodospirillaceae bacterium]
MAIHNVPPETGPGTRAAAREVLAAIDLAPEGFTRPDTFAEEIELIFEVQRAVLTIAPEDVGIPRGQSRNLRALIDAGHGLCYDRSRAMETILSLYGFETRHVAVYGMDESEPDWRTWITPGGPSHAVSEVLTRQGWLLLDSNEPWLGLTADGRVIGVRDLQRHPDLAWDSRVRASLSPIFESRFRYIYGLYSRHGEF